MIKRRIKKRRIHPILRMAPKVVAVGLVGSLMYSTLGGSTLVESASYTMKQGQWTELDPTATIIPNKDASGNAELSTAVVAYNAKDVISAGNDMTLGTVIASTTQTTSSDFSATNPAGNTKIGVSFDATRVTGDAITLSNAIHVTALQTDDTSNVAIASKDGAPQIFGGWDYGTSANGSVVRKKDASGALIPGNASSLVLNTEAVKSIIYVTNIQYKGGLLGGIAGADAKCSIDSNKPGDGITESIKAFLPVASRSLASMAADYPGKVYWYGTTGNTTLLADDWASMIDTNISIKAPQELGTGINKAPWSAKRDGLYYYTAGTANNSCNNWTSQGDGTLGAFYAPVGSAVSTADWLNAATTNTQACNTQAPLRCVARYNKQEAIDVGTYTAYLDAGASANGTYTWDDFAWVGQYAAGTKLSFKIKSSSSTTAPDFTNSACEVNNITANGNLAGLASNASNCVNTTHKYLHYKVTFFANTASHVSPELESVSATALTSGTTYLTSGTYTSEVFDVGIVQGYDTVDFATTKPSGATVKVKVRSCAAPAGSTANNGGCEGGVSFDSCDAISESGGNIPNVNNCINNVHRYMQYQTTLTTFNETQTPTMEDIQVKYDKYPTTEQTLTSAKYNTEDPTNLLADLQWGEGTLATPDLPANTQVNFYLRTGATSADLDANPWVVVASSTPSGIFPAGFCQKDGGGAVTCNHNANPLIPASMRDGVEDQWYQYKVGLLSGDGDYTPTIRNVNVVYVINQPPSFNPDYPVAGEGGMTATFKNDGNIEIKYSIKDEDTDAGTPINRGKVTTSFEYSDDGGTNWHPVTTGLPGGATTTKDSVVQNSYTQHTINWDAGEQLGNAFYTNNMKIRVHLDDGEAARATASSTQLVPFTVDLKKPEIIGANGVSLDASGYIAPGSPVKLYVNARDDSPLNLIVKVGSTEATASTKYSGQYTTTAAPIPNIVLGNYGESVYVTLVDEFNNTHIQTLTPLTRPAIGVMKDVSTNAVGSQALFFSWQPVVGVAQADFDGYYIYRAETQNVATITPLKKIIDVEQNYYRDASVTRNRQYFYKIIAVDSVGSQSAPGSASGTASYGDGVTLPVPPTITNVATSSQTSNSIIITWQTSDANGVAMNTDALVKYQTSPGGDFANAQSHGKATYESNHSVTLENLTPNTTYYFVPESKDPQTDAVRVGINPNSINGYSFTTDAGPAAGDTTPPVITLNGVDPTNLKVGETYTELATSTDNEDGDITANIIITVDGVVATDNLHPIDTTVDKIYILKYNVTDASGNHAIEQTRYVRVSPADTDTTPPVITLNGVDPTNLKVGETYTELATSTDNEDGDITANIIITVDGVVATDNLHPIDTTVVGEHVIKYNVSDAKGNPAAEQKRYVNVSLDTTDTTPPTFATNPTVSTPAEPTSATISWSMSEGATRIFNYGLAANALNTPNNDGAFNQSHTLTLTGLTPNTTYFFSVSGADAVGNTVVTPYLDSFTTAEEDTTAPVLIGVPSVGSLGANAATIAWSTNENATARVEYSETANTFDQFDDDNSTTRQTDHQIQLTGLSPNTTYYYRLKSQDSSLNTLLADNNYEFTTTAIGTLAINSPITITQGVTEATIVWKTNSASNSTVDYAKDAAYTIEPSNASDATPTILHAVTLTGLSAETVYNFKVTSDDGHGGIATSTNAVFKTLKEGAPVVPPASSLARSSSAPSISDISVANITDTAMTVTWDTNKSSDSVVELITNSSSDFSIAQSQGMSELVTAHSVKVRHLLPGTTYYLRVRSTSGSKTSRREYATPVTTLGEKGDTPNEDEKVSEPAKQEPGGDEKEVALFTDEDKATPIKEIRDLIEKFGKGLSGATIKESFSSIVKQLKAKLPSPAINGKPDIVATEDGAIVTWQTNRETNSILMLASADDYAPNTDAPYSRQIGDAKVYTKLHEVLVPNLLSSTEYHIKVQGRTESGVVVGSDDVSFTTLARAPVVSNAGMKPISDTEVTVFWATNVRASSLVKLTPYDIASGTYDEAHMKVAGKDALTTNHSIDVHGLVPGTKYAVVLEGENASGIKYRYDLKGLSTGDDKEPPVISSIKTESALLPGKGAEVRSIISWATDEDATSQVAYTEVKDNKKLTEGAIQAASQEQSNALKEGKSKKKKIFTHSSGITITTPNKGLAQSHIAVLAEFEQGKTYAFKILSTDESLNTAVSDTYVIMIPQKSQSVFDMIVKTFESRFRWMKR